MKVLLSAKNMVGDVADYEIDADSQEDVVNGMHRLYAKPGIVLVKVKPEHVEMVHALPRKVKQ